MNTPLEFFSHSPLDIGSKLYRDYCAGHKNLSPFFRYPYFQDFQRFESKNTPRELDFDQKRREQVSEILIRWNRKIGNTSEAVSENLEKFRRPQTYCVVTGQQTTIFLGPLYTIYKSLTAIALCDDLKQKFPFYEFTPIFWCSADDHDFYEITTTRYVNDQNQTIRQQYQTEDSHLKPAYELPTPENLKTLANEMLSANFPFHEKIHRLVHETLDQAESVGHWFHLLASRLIGRLGLILIPSHLPVLRRLMQPIFSREIRQGGKSTRLVRDSGQRLTKLGYHGQIERRPGALNIFYHRDKRRYRITKIDDHFEMDQIDKCLSLSELEQSARESPEFFSPGAALRPVVQDYLLPTAAYVAGPGEIAYFAQLDLVYDMFDVRMPTIFPRSGLTILEPKIKRLTKKYNLSVKDVADQKQGLIRRVMSESFSTELDQQFASARREVGEILHRITPQIRKIDEGAFQFSEKMFGKIDFMIGQTRKKVFQAHKKKNRTVRLQLETVLNHIFPDNKLQERSIHIFPFLEKYGEEMIDDLLLFIKKELTDLGKTAQRDEYFLRKQKIFDASFTGERRAVD
ncbi:MAG: bacillithiol biosynthesis cysteine-adding enzyme BshC [Candidatus Cloacimonetes bacterium 4572_55]|nr:MAG: bacillithiol biosynthesis cysteine-adding enzyme BshC [Candidatus Cloacimonetes bacterium 4572_55]